MNADDYRSSCCSLFKEWKSIMGANHGKVLVKDGVVCPEEWFSKGIRPLFLLKEAYGKEEDFCLVKDLLLQHERAIDPGTWLPVSVWTKGLFQVFENNEPKEDTYEKDYETARKADDVQNFGNKHLEKIAVVNVKKYNGKSLSDMREINHPERPDLLFRQIRLCDPTLIICGYTGKALNTILKTENITLEEIKGVKWGYKFKMTPESGPVYVIKFWHPANRFKQSCYAALMESLVQLKQYMDEEAAK